MLVVAGGMDFFQQPVPSVEVLILSKQPRWVSLGDLKRPRSWYPALGLLRNRIMIGGGQVFCTYYFRYLIHSTYFSWSICIYHFQAFGEADDSVEIYAPKEKEWKISSQHQLAFRRFDGRSALVPVNWYPNCVILA